MKLLPRKTKQTLTASPADSAGLASAIAPGGIELSRDSLSIGKGKTATLCVSNYPAEVGFGWLEPMLSWPGRLDLALHIDPIPNSVAASRLKTQRARLESSRRSDLGKGRLADPQTEAAAEDAAELATQVARGAAKLFDVGVYLTVHARTDTELAQAVTQVTAAAASTLLDLEPATWRPLHGWCTTLPLGHDGLKMRRTMDTAALAASFPLSSPDLPSPLPGDETGTTGVLYGVNPDSGGVVWWDRFAADNHNMVVLGRSGGGKSYFVKLDLLRNLYQGVHAAVIDPEDEYIRLARAVGGTVVALGKPGVRLNPFDLSRGDKRPDVLTRRGLFLHTLIAVLVGSGQDDPQGLDAGQRAALDRGILAVYRHAGITSDPKTHRRRPPLLRDLAAVLKADTDPAATLLAARLAPWVEGSFKDLFAGPTTEAPEGHLVVWSLRQLPDELRGVGTLLALDHIWRQVDLPSPATGEGSGPQARRRQVVVDEAWLLMRTTEGAKFLYRMAKAARKRNAGLTVVTQDAADVLSSDLGLAVVSNASTQILLRQASQAIDTVGDAFALTDGEKRLLLAARRGTGLLISGTSRTRFEAIASPTEHDLAGAPGQQPDEEEDDL